MGLTSVLLLISCFAASVHSHGYLMEPPGRASAWRFGFDTPVDYNDNECFCGGFSYQYQEMGGKCSICGDAWDADPRPHEVGGIYATGTLVRNYRQGQIISVMANVTANHLGHFEYKICANNDVTVEATQECLDLTPLYGVGHEEWNLYIGDAKGAISHELQLPVDLECSQCVLQWRYVASNTWGICDNGTEGTGCGPQEEFRGCADVSILAPSREWEGSVDLLAKLEEPYLSAANKEEKTKEGNVNAATDEEQTEEEETAQVPQESASKLKEMPSAMKFDDHDAERTIKKESKRDKNTEEESDNDSGDESEDD